jgi:hypothetical protein
MGVQESLPLSVMEIVQQAGTQIGFRSQTMYLTADSAGEGTSVARSSDLDRTSGLKPATRNRREESTPKAQSVPLYYPVGEVQQYQRRFWRDLDGELEEGQP